MLSLHLVLKLVPMLLGTPFSIEHSLLKMMKTFEEYVVFKEIFVTISLKEDPNLPVQTIVHPDLVRYQKILELYIEKIANTVRYLAV